jgi:DNA-directed RNA polymerase alpha subunit
MRNGHRNLWTNQEDDQLRELIAGKASPTLMSAKLKRSPEAIRIRSLILRKKDAASVLVLATPALPDETPISRVNLPTRIRNVLTAEGIKTVGEARETSDETLLSFQDLGKGSVAELRQLLGLPSIEG